MANRTQAVPENVDGDFFVDTTCIDCGTCQHVAPATFDDAGDTAFVHRQPQTADEAELALKALLACPVGSIGTDASENLKAVRDLFPLPITDTVYYCGFTSPKSYGASSYFVKRPEGNWLIDSPKFLPALVAKFEAWGGISRIFLSHSDDVAEADRYAAHFKAQRVMHAAEIWSQPGVEHVIEGDAPVPIDEKLVVIPTPGHTEGHCVLLYDNRVLFSGDHLWWNLKKQALVFPTHYVWRRKELIASVEKLLDHSFEWLLPGHDAPIHLPDGKMHKALAALVASIRH